MTRESYPSTRGLRKASSQRPPSTTKQKRISQRLRYLSHYDALTTLPNRAFFRNRLAKAITAAQESRQTLGVLFLSLDPYGRINETLGPAMGDRLVRCVARRLKTFMGGDEALCYWGGDKFVLMLEDAGDEVRLSNIAQAIKKRIERRVFSFKQEFFPTLSIGIGLFPLHGSTAETLLKNAGAALFEAQECGENSFRFYTADLNGRALKRFALENRLGGGLQRRQFFLHYQPQVQTSTWQVTGAEALIRWEHPQLGPIPPAEFIPLAEKSGLIIPIGEWVVRAACQQLRKWRSSGLGELSLAINVSARQFQEPASVDAIVGILKETGINPECLELELTESALLTDADHVIKSLAKLKDFGVKLAIDDFGTGFSSLEYLRRLPLDTLKIARSFVQDTATDDGAALISSIVALAHWLRLRVVAEGVETEEQMEFLQGLGCDGMQGYLFSRPLPGEEFKTMVARSAYRLEGRNESSDVRAAS